MAVGGSCLAEGGVAVGLVLSGCLFEHVGLELVPICELHGRRVGAWFRADQLANLVHHGHNGTANVNIWTCQFFAGRELTTSVRTIGWA